jgi:small subunit ribosomal protein S1
MSEEMNQMTDVLTLKKGDIVKGRVTKVEDTQAIVHVGYKFDGVLPIGELSPLRIERVSDVLAEGDEVEVKVLRINDEEGKLILSKKAVDAEKAWERLQRAYEEGEVLEVKVADVVKGGLVVDLGVRAFIPASLVEQHYVEDFSDYKGRTLRVKIIEFDRENNKVILSAKAVLEEEMNRMKEERLQSLQPGQLIDGVVQRLTNFGVFVDVGGVDGLVHISELAWHRVENPEEVVQVGDRVKVKVLKVDPEKGRLSLSIKEAQPGPWSGVEEKFKPGDIVTGTVKRLVSFGAFVELLPGVEGLVHISQIANRHIATPQEVLEVGQQVKVKVLEVSEEKQRISLSIRQAESEKSRRDVKEYAEKTHTHGTGVTIGDVFGDLFKKNQ